MNTHNIIHTNTYCNILLDITLCINCNIINNITRNIIMKIHSTKIIKLIEKERVVTSSEVAESFGVSWNTAEKYLMELALEGRVDRIKKAGVTLWLLK